MTVSIWPKYSSGRVCVPVWYFLIYYPAYVLVFGFFAVGMRYNIMTDLLPTIGNVELIIVAVVALLTSVYMIRAIITNEFEKTRKKKYAIICEALESRGEGAQLTQLEQITLDQLASFDKGFKRTMWASIAIAIALSVSTVIGASAVFATVGTIWACGPASFAVSFVVAVLFGKLAQFAGSGELDSKVGDKIIDGINDRLAPIVENVPQEITPAVDDRLTNAILDAVMAKIGKKSE